MKKNILLKGLLVGVMGSVGALADMTVDKSNGALTVTSTISGTVSAKVIGPNDKVLIDESFEGNSFSWTPSGTDGAYRYEVRVGSTEQEVVPTNDIQAMAGNTSNTKNDYAGGFVHVVNGQILATQNTDENEEGEEK